VLTILKFVAGLFEADMLLALRVVRGGFGNLTTDERRVIVLVSNILTWYIFASLALNDKAPRRSWQDSNYFLTKSGFRRPSCHA